MRPGVRLAAWAGALTALALVFSAYLSPHLVVDLANRVMRPRSGLPGVGDALQGVNLVAQQPPGPEVEFGSHPEEADEARTVVTWLQARADEGVPWREMAVLFRINAQAPALEAALSERNIPYIVRGSERFYDRPEIKQSLAQLRAATRAEPEGPGLPLVKGRA